MIKTNKVEFKNNTREELFPEYSEKFQCISSYVEFNSHKDKFVPWHWHQELELFYVEKGMIEYYTPNSNIVFHEGSGGLVNGNVLHMTQFDTMEEKNIQLLHLFDPVFIVGEKGNLIDTKYMIPFTNSAHAELIAFSEEIEEHKEVLKLLRESFDLDEKEYGYELILRGKLSEIWLKVMQIAEKQMDKQKDFQQKDFRIKQMMMYIHEHYAEKITVKDLVDCALMSERVCYRLFQENLHTTPTDYIRCYRLHMARQMLSKSNMSLSEIGYACGLGSNSYFGKQFKEYVGCTPKEYRNRMAEF